MLPTSPLVPSPKLSPRAGFFLVFFPGAWVFIMPIVIDTSSLFDLGDMIENDSRTRAIIMPYFKQASQDMLDYCVDEAPKREGTGNNLSKSLGVTFSDGFASTIAADDSLCPYAKYVFGGTRKHKITAVHKKALFWPFAKHPVKSVMHPGAKPNPFLLASYVKHEAEYIATIEKGLAEVFA